MWPNCSAYNYHFGVRNFHFSIKILLSKHNWPKTPKRILISRCFGRTNCILLANKGSKVVFNKLATLMEAVRQPYILSKFEY